MEERKRRENVNHDLFKTVFSMPVTHYDSKSNTRETKFFKVVTPIMIPLPSTLNEIIEKYENSQAQYKTYYIRYNKTVTATVNFRSERTKVEKFLTCTSKKVDQCSKSKMTCKSNTVHQFLSILALTKRNSVCT
jgi:hypothetical protein